MNKFYQLVGGAILLVAVSVGISYAIAPKSSPSLGSYTNGGVVNGNAQLNNVTFGSLGFSNTFSTSTALSAAQFCGTTNERWIGTTALATATLPSATSTYLACTGGFGALGGWQNQLITNDSTNTVNFVAGPGMSFLCETNGVGTTTIVGGCTQSQVSVNASSVVATGGFWDAGSSTMYITWGNEWYN
jgi:hypothetical protein